MVAKLWLKRHEENEGNRKKYNKNKETKSKSKHEENVFLMTVNFKTISRRFKVNLEAIG